MKNRTRQAFIISKEYKKNLIQTLELVGIAQKNSLQKMDSVPIIWEYDT